MGRTVKEDPMPIKEPEKFIDPPILEQVLLVQTTNRSDNQKGRNDERFFVFFRSGKHPPFRAFPDDPDIPGLLWRDYRKLCFFYTS